MEPRHPGDKGLLDFAGVSAADIRQRGQDGGAIRHERLERVVLDGWRARGAKLRRKVVDDDFLQHKLEQFNFSVAFDEPLERLRKLIELLRVQLS